MDVGLVTHEPQSGPAQRMECAVAGQPEQDACWPKQGDADHRQHDKADERCGVQHQASVYLNPLPPKESIS